jgi:hypothetical protein
MIVRPATLADAHYLKSRLRQADRAEVKAGTRRSPQEIVPLSFALSTACFAICKEGDDRPIALYGVSPQHEGPCKDGIVWMLCSPRIKEVSKSLLRSAPDLVRELQQYYPKLHNVVHARNATGVKWVRAAGFQLHYATLVNGEPFIYFSTKEQEADNV